MFATAFGLRSRGGEARRFRAARPSRGIVRLHGLASVPLRTIPLRVPAPLWHVTSSHSMVRSPAGDAHEPSGRSAWRPAPKTASRSGRPCALLFGRSEPSGAQRSDVREDTSPEGSQTVTPPGRRGPDVRARCFPRTSTALTLFSFSEGLSPDPPPRGMKPRGSPTYEPSLTSFAARRPVGRLAKSAQLLFTGVGSGRQTAPQRTLRLERPSPQGLAECAMVDRMPHIARPSAVARGTSSRSDALPVWA